MSDKSSLFSAAQLGAGDLDSDAKGSGARFNAGKPPFELVPIRSIARFHDDMLELRCGSGDEAIRDAVQALYCLATFQENAGRDRGALLGALSCLGDGWTECARVFGYGSIKYKAWNWARGMPWSVPLACAVRHLRAIIEGQPHDDESGETHRGHVYCNICMLLTYLDTYREGDDRAKPGLLAPIEVAT